MEFDVLIVTALLMERDAALQAGQTGVADHPGVTSWADLDGDERIRVGTYVLADGGQFSVAIAYATRMGGVAAAQLATELVQRLHPGCLAMCGVCAGNPRALALGDVVIAEMAYAYDEGKRTEHGFVGDRASAMRQRWRHSCGCSSCWTSATSRATTPRANSTSRTTKRGPKGSTRSRPGAF